MFLSVCHWRAVISLHHTCRTLQCCYRGPLMILRNVVGVFLIERRTIHFWNFNIFVIKLAFLITLSKPISPTEPLHIFPCLQKLFLKDEFQRQFLIKAWRYRYKSDVLKLNQTRWCTKFFNRCNQSLTLQIFTTLSLVGILWHHTQFTSKHWVSVRHGKYDFFFEVSFLNYETHNS